MQRGVVISALGLLFCGVGGILVIVALATTNWFKIRMTEKSLDFRQVYEISFGLFEYCVDVGEGNSQHSGCRSMILLTADSGFDHLRGLFITGVILCFFGICTAFVGLTKSSNKNYRKAILAAALTAVASGGLVILGDILFKGIPSHMKKTYSFSGGVILQFDGSIITDPTAFVITNYELSWSFAMSVAGGAIMLLSSIFTFLGYGLLNYDKTHVDSALSPNTTPQLDSMDDYPGYVISENAPSPYYPAAQNAWRWERL